MFGYLGHLHFRSIVQLGHKGILQSRLSDGVIYIQEMIILSSLIHIVTNLPDRSLKEDPTEFKALFDSLSEVCCATRLRLGPNTIFVLPFGSSVPDFSSSSWAVSGDEVWICSCESVGVGVAEMMVVVAAEVVCGEDEGDLQYWEEARRLLSNWDPSIRFEGKKAGSSCNFMVSKCLLNPSSSLVSSWSESFCWCCVESLDGLETKESDCWCSCCCSCCIGCCCSCCWFEYIECESCGESASGLFVVRGTILEIAESIMESSWGEWWYRWLLGAAVAVALAAISILEVIMGASFGPVESPWCSWASFHTVELRCWVRDDEERDDTGRAAEDNKNEYVLVNFLRLSKLLPCFWLEGRLDRCVVVEDVDVDTVGGGGGEAIVLGRPASLIRSCCWIPRSWVSYMKAAWRTR